MNKINSNQIMSWVFIIVSICLLSGISFGAAISAKPVVVKTGEELLNDAREKVCSKAGSIEFTEKEWTKVSTLPGPITSERVGGIALTITGGNFECSLVLGKICSVPNGWSSDRKKSAAIKEQIDTAPADDATLTRKVKWPGGVYQPLRNANDHRISDVCHL